MKLKLKVVSAPGSYRRLEVFRRICPDPPSDFLPGQLLYELDSDWTFLQRPMENIGHSTVERSAIFMPQQSPANGLISSREFSAQSFISTTDGNAALTKDLSEALMQLQISGQNSEYRPNQGSLTIQENGSLRVAPPGWNTNCSASYTPSNYLTNTTNHNGIPQNSVNGDVSMDMLHSPTHLLPRDLMEEINYIGMSPPRSTDNGQYYTQDRQMQFMAQQPLTDPVNFYVTEFGVQYIGPRPINGINLSPSSLPNHINFSNEIYGQGLMNTANKTQPALLDHMNISNEFCEARRLNTNLSQPILLDHLNFSNEFYNQQLVSPINQLQSTPVDYMNLYNEFYNQTLMNPINQPQPTPVDYMNSYNEFYNQMLMNPINSSQSTSVDHMNYFNEYSQLMSMNNIISSQPPLVNDMNFYNEFSEPMVMNNMNLLQPPVPDHMNLFNGLPETNPVNLPQQTLMGAMNFSNELLEPRPINPINFSQPTLFDYMNFHNEYLEARPTNTLNLQQPNGLDCLNFYNEFSMPHIPNPIENYVNENGLQWSIQNPFPEYINGTGANLLPRNSPRPILNRNYLNEIPAQDLFSALDEINSTEDYTTEYSKTHVIARPTTLNTIRNDAGPYVSQNNVIEQQLNSPLRYTNTYDVECPFAYRAPRPILNRRHLDEFAKPYGSQNPVMDHLNPPYYTNPHTETPYSLPVQNHMINGDGIDNFSMIHVSQNSGLDQINPVLNHTNPYAEFLAPHMPGNNIVEYLKPQATLSNQINFLTDYTNPNTNFAFAQNMQRLDFHPINGFSISNTPQNCVMAQMNGIPHHTNSEISQVSELSELSPNE